MRKRLISRLQPLARDLFILVAGIMLSLMLNECRENSSSDRNEQRIVQQLLLDLKADTAALNLAIFELKEVFQEYKTMLDQDSIIEIRYFAAMNLDTFSPFRPNRTGIQELAFSGKQESIRRADLMAKAINLHDSEYDILTEIETLFTTYMLADYVPYFNDNFAYLKAQGFTKAELVSVGMVLESAPFLNRADWMVTLLSNNVQALRDARKKAIEIIGELENY